MIRAAKADGSAVWGLFGISFLYGVFHAAGPGHGKAVISSYLVANEETWRRGVVLSFASALLQALVAVAIVGIAAVAASTRPRRRCATPSRVIEIVELRADRADRRAALWVKGAGFFEHRAQACAAAAARRSAPRSRRAHHSTITLTSIMTRPRASPS